VGMWGCGDVGMWGCGDVGCGDVGMWGCVVMCADMCVRALCACVRVPELSEELKQGRGVGEVRFTQFVSSVE
jgi:hypothetical protein